MLMKDICPCVNLECPNHGHCENCVSRHLNKGSLNYCAFYTVLPRLRDAIASSPDSPTAQKLSAMIDNQLEAYAKLMAKHGLTQEGQNRLLNNVAGFSEY